MVESESAKLPLRVLIVEDDDALATMLARVLRTDGYFVTLARDGDEALAAFEREGPHACLVDALLPKMNGFEVCKEIRKRVGDRVGLLMMSATFRALGPRSEALRDSGADGFIAKPFVLSDVRKRVKELGERSEGARRVAAAPASVARGFANMPRTSAGEVPDLGPFDGAHHVARALFDCARQKLNGLLAIEQESSRLEIALLAGVPVGARDNLRENQLGERMLRDGTITHDDLKRVNDRIAKGERVAEALLSLGLCDASAVLEIIEDQVLERVNRALTWRRGTLRFTEGEDAARALAVRSVDLVEHVLEWALDVERDPTAMAFLLARASERLVPTPDFDDGLPAYAARRPTSRLPQLLLAPGADTTVDGIAKSAPGDANDLYALWLASLLRFESEPAQQRMLPRPAVSARAKRTPAQGPGAKVVAALLRLRGRPPWQALGTPPDSPVEVLDAAFATLKAEVGPDALAGQDLGDQRAAAKELWDLLEQLELEIAIFSVEQGPPAAIPKPMDISPEQAFLDGQIALAKGEMAVACQAFERALASKPNDPDMNAWQAWASILAGDDETMAMDVLETAARAYPEAMRPVYFLGLAAKRRGDVGKARDHLEEAAARAPFDVEVREARKALSA